MLGIIANPASGKDIRRLISGASVFDNQEKRNIVRRAALAAVAVGETKFRHLSDTHGISRSALEGAVPDGDVAGVEIPMTDSALDTSRAASRMKEAGCGAVLVLGGDGTNRAAAMGWQDIPVIAVSTGTNNVFPRMVEGTLAGLAGGLIATGQVDLDEAASQVKAVHLSIEGEHDDLALIDAALVAGPFVGAKAVWDPNSLRALVLTRAEPASVGLSSIAALMEPLFDEDERGLYLRVGGTSCRVMAPIAPGLMASVPIDERRSLSLGEEVVFKGPGVIALDGERERRLKPDQKAVLRVRRDGPWAIDVSKTLEVAVRKGLFLEGAGNGD